MPSILIEMFTMLCWYIRKRCYLYSGLRKTVGQ